MLFSSPRFFLFLAALLAVLALPLGRRPKKRVLAVASCLFYAAWDFRYLGLLLLVSVIDYVCANRIAASSSHRVRRDWLAASVVSNLGILSYFKYTNFVVDNLNALGTSFPHADIILPAGISFYTFKSMSYTIDVYRREIEPCESWLDYATFVTFFPELIAGPIVRASVFLPQLDRPIGITLERLRIGGSRFLLGLTKKLVIAERMAPISDAAFAHPDLFSARALWCAVIAYAIQIYADFSGYSDMAIGIAKIIGYDLPVNFAMPYGSRDITEFWRRWHITLSSWLRDYLYIPLGGNRHGASRTYVNLAVTMLLGGLWHGASWNFVLWGALHGGALALHRGLTRGRRSSPLPGWLARSLTLLFVVLCWVPFRAANMTVTVQIFRGLAGQGPGRVTFISFAVVWVTALLVAAHALGAELERQAAGSARRLERVLGFFDVRLTTNPLSSWSLTLGGRGLGGAFIVTAWLLALLLGSVLSNNPFIYFQF